MNKILFFILLLSLFPSCTPESNEKKEPKDSSLNSKSNFRNSIITKQPVDTLTKSIKSTATDSIKTHLFKKGETLWKLGKTYYGNRHYSSIISSFNNINPNKIEPGTQIQIPPLEQLFKIANPDSSKYHQAITLLLKARIAFMMVEKDLWDLRSETKHKGKQNLSKRMEEGLLTSAIFTDSANIAFKNLLSDRKIASNVKYQLGAVSSNLKQLAEGSSDGYGYDLDMVHQNMNHALGYLLVAFKQERESASRIDSIQ